MKKCLSCLSEKSPLWYKGPTCKDCAALARTARFEERAAHRALRKLRSKPKVTAAIEKKSSFKSQIKYKYGLTVEAFETMLKGQNRVCAICEKHNARAGDVRLVIDHDHKTGQVRALLCHNCNSALGLAGDSSHALLKLARYLKKHGK